MENKKYDYSNIEHLSGLEYKYSMAAVVALLAIHFDFLDIAGGSLWIILTTGLAVYIWWSFRTYFVQVNDKATAKWLLIIIFTLILFGVSNLLFHTTTNLYDEIPTNAIVFSLFQYLFYFVIFSLIAFITVCIKIITTNKHHSFPLKRIGISSALFIPLYIFVISISNVQFIWQLKDVANVIMADPTGGMLTPPDFFSGIFSRIKFVWNLIIMIPYYFLFFHFYKADQSNAYEN